MKTLQNKKLIEKYIEQYHIGKFIPQKYFDSLILLEYKTGELICNQEELLQNLYFFISGKIKIIRTLPNGKEHVLDIRENACILGEIELMADKPFVSSVVVIKKSHVLALPVARMRKQLMNDSSFLYTVGTWMANELYQSDIDRMSAALCSVKEQLAIHLLSLNTTEAFSLDRSILADKFGTSYRHLLRVINSFVEEGILERQNHKYRILNREKLETIIDN